MVLVPELTEEEIQRHHALIRDFALYATKSQDVKIEFLDNGKEKGVYKVNLGDQEIVAAAAKRDPSVDLSEEYWVLNQLYAGVPEFFPRPELCYNPRQSELLGQLLIMSLLPHVNLQRFRSGNLDKGLNKNLAYLIGRSIAIVQAKTGRVSSDPHDGNILARNTNRGIEMAFCDAIQFIPGSLEDGVRCILANKEERPECFRFISKFRDGLADGVCATSDQPITRAQVYPQLEYLREFNDVF